jgi:ribosomal protein L1
MIKEHMKQEHKDKKQKKREEVLKLIDELKETKTVKNNENTIEKIVHLLGYDLLRKTKKLSQKEINTINLMHNKLNEILPKS